MALTVPASDAEGYKLAGVVTARAAAVTAANSAGNYPLAAVHTAEKTQAQLNLLLYLLSSGKLNPNTVLANETYGT
jgi:hypothetical protein